MASRITRHPSLAPAHPGEQLEEIVIPATGRSKSEIARLLGISRQTLYEIINGARPITPSIAARLGKLFGDGPGIWLRMQAAHDAWVAEREIDVSDIPTLHASRS
jgi:antitoxin HigA-1